MSKAKVVHMAVVIYNIPQTKDYDYLDAPLRKLARKHNGSETGSGFGGSRDISFEFKTEKSARNFLTAAKTEYGRRVKTDYGKYIES